MHSNRNPQLIRFALAVLEEPVGEAYGKSRRQDATPIRRTWGIRLALAYLHSCGIGEKWLHDQYWKALTDTVDNPPAIAAYVRSSALNTTVDRLFVLAGMTRGVHSRGVD